MNVSLCFRETESHIVCACVRACVCLCIYEYEYRNVTFLYSYSYIGDAHYVRHLPLSDSTDPYIQARRNTSHLYTSPHSDTL